MENIFSKENIISEFKNYLEWEKESFENWDSVEIFIADTLSEAWIMARPSDKHKFSDEEFKEMVDNANGKWLEKTDPSDSYKIILSTIHSHTVQDMTRRFVHEMRHCLDFQNAVKDLSFDEYHPGNLYYKLWSEFRAVYFDTRYEFFTRHNPNMDYGEVFDILAELLGKKSANSTIGLMRSEDDFHDTLYFLSRYIGASRAVRNLEIENSLDAEVFHHKIMTPYYIFDNFGDGFFYIGDDWDDTEVCELNAEPKSSYFDELLNRVSSRLN